MTQEDKELLLKDLCARLPYGVYCKGITKEYDGDKDEYIDVEVENTLLELHNYKCAYGLVGLMNECDITTIKPYLRPMSSMTEEETEEYEQMVYDEADGCYNDGRVYYTGNKIINIDDVNKLIDWLNAHQFDYRGLIDRGLALKAPEDMYKE